MVNWSSKQSKAANARARLTSLLLSFVSLFLFCDNDFIMAQEAEERGAADQEPEMYKGLEVAVIELERTDSWNNFGQVVRPKNRGDEIVVVHLELRFPGPTRETLQESKGVVLEDYELEDVSGAFFESNMKRISFYPAKGVERSVQELPFAVPRGTKLRSLKLGDVLLELSGFEADEGEE